LSADFLGNLFHVDLGIAEHSPGSEVTTGDGGSVIDVTEGGSDVASIGTVDEPTSSAHTHNTSSINQSVTIVADRTEGSLSGGEVSTVASHGLTGVSVEVESGVAGGTDLPGGVTFGTVGVTSLTDLDIGIGSGGVPESVSGETASTTTHSIGAVPTVGHGADLAPSGGGIQVVARLTGDGGSIGVAGKRTSVTLHTHSAVTSTNKNVVINNLSEPSNVGVVHAASTSKGSGGGVGDGTTFITTSHGRIISIACATDTSFSFR